MNNNSNSNSNKEQQKQHYYNVYCNYCKHYNIKPMDYKDFKLEQFYPMYLSFNSFYGNTNYK